jgi:hypothetical protein
MKMNYGVASMAKFSRFHPLVADDLSFATGYYNDVASDLGNRFRNSVRQRLKSIQDCPESYGVIHQQIRAVILSRFPYVILFELREAPFSFSASFTRPLIAPGGSIAQFEIANSQGGTARMARSRSHRMLHRTAANSGAASQLKARGDATSCAFGTQRHAVGPHNHDFTSP